jgi:hypothetical protein
MLLTSQVGGLGLNLVGADRVIICEFVWQTMHPYYVNLDDMSWNPATDNQAVDRAFRIGQKRNVVVYRLICSGTIEESIYEKQVRKSGLAQSTFVAESQFRYFDMNDLKKLFTLGDIHDSFLMREFNAIHEKDRKTYPELVDHIEQLMKMEIIGVSDNDLLYSKHESPSQFIEEHEFTALIPKRGKSFMRPAASEPLKKDNEPAKNLPYGKSKTMTLEEYQHFLRTES